MESLPISEENKETQAEELEPIGGEDGAEGVKEPGDAAAESEKK